MSDDSASGHRPAELADADWLRRRYEVDGDKKIAAHLGVSHETVRRARVRLGIVSRPRGGSERGRSYPAMRVRPVKTAAMQIGERIAHESAPHGPAPSLTLVAVRVRALHESQQDRAAHRDALVSLASACGLVLDHLQRL